MFARVALTALAVISACGGKAAEDPLRRAVLDFNGHIIIMKSSTEFTEYRDTIALVRTHPDVVDAYPFVFVEAMVTAHGHNTGVGLKGVDLDRTPLGRRITPPGVLRSVPAAAVPAPMPVPASPPPSPSHSDPAPADFPTDSDPPPPPADFTASADPSAPLPGALPMHVVIGVELARTLEVHVGDTIELVLPPQIDTTTWTPPDAPPIHRTARVVGTFQINAEYDQRVVLTTFEAAQELQGLGDRALGVEIRVKHAEDAAGMARELKQQLGPPYEVLDWCELNKAALRC